MRDELVRVQKDVGEGKGEYCFIARHLKVFVCKGIIFNIGR